MSIIRELARLGNKIDSASTGQFLSKGSTTGSFGTISYTDLTGRPTTLDSSAATSIVDSAYIQARQSAAGGGGLDSALTTQLIDSSYIAARAAAGSSGYQMYEYTATQGQTTFQDSDTNGNILSYSEGGALVFYNGVLLGASDITATSGSSVVLTTGADSGSHVAIAKWSLAGGGGSGAAFTWGGDRAIVAGGISPSNTILYFDMTTAGNTISDFGDLTAARKFLNGGCSNGTRGVVMGGYGSARVNIMDYITIASTGNATDFGDLVSAGDERTGASNGTYGLAMGGNIGGYTNQIDYITIDTTGNASDFGDHSQNLEGVSSASDATYVLFAGGNGPINNIEYVTADTPGNTSDFGDLVDATDTAVGLSDATRCVFAGGLGSLDHLDTISYVTTTTPGNASDFGNLTRLARWKSPASNGTLGVFSGGYNNSGAMNTIDYITIQTTGDATDWGDLPSTEYSHAGFAGNAS